jgi:molybdopterin/thiamine biosynthesis adenylyltransferase
MAHILQIGAGSGGMVVLDLIARDPSVTRVTLIEPDVYKPHNVHRHLFPASAVGRMKADLAAEWVRERRADIVIEPVIADLTDPTRQEEFARFALDCDVGVCAVDKELAKYAFDALMRAAGKPWTLGEVLSGGIGGWVHRFTPGGACYGCVASYLQRTVSEEPTQPPPDYSNPGGAVPETTVPANKASIGVIASLHAVMTLEMLADGVRSQESGVGSQKSGVSGDRLSSSPTPDSRLPTPELTPGSRPPTPETSLLFTLARVPGVFEEVFRPYRFRIPKSPGCLVCGAAASTRTGEDLDVAVGEALDRLAPQ